MWSKAAGTGGRSCECRRNIDAEQFRLSHDAHPFLAAETIGVYDEEVWEAVKRQGST